MDHVEDQTTSVQSERETRTNTVQISGRWISYVCQLRGVPCPSFQVLDAGLKASDSTEQEIIYNIVLRLQNGTDRADDMHAAMEWIRTLEYRANKIAESAPVSPVAKAQEHSSQVRESQARQGTKSSGRVPQGTKESSTQPRNGKDSHHVYGKRAAICVEPEVIEDAYANQNVHSLILEIAPAIAAKRYDWENKVRFRFTKRELPIFAGLLMGWIKTVRFENHGSENDKALVADDQGGHVFLKIKHATLTHAVQIPSEEVFHICAMAVTAIAKNMNGIDTQTVMMMIKRLAQMRCQQPGCTDA